MKMYTNSEQTAKLIELGFAKPPKKGLLFQSNIGDCHTDLMVAEENYSLGELIEILPPSYSDRWKGDCYLIIRHDSVFWFVGYIVSGARKPHIRLSNIEFIDALYDMILKLKAEEII